MDVSLVSADRASTVQARHFGLRFLASLIAFQHIVIVGFDLNIAHPIGTLIIDAAHDILIGFADASLMPMTAV